MPNFISPGQKRPLTTQTVQNVTPRRPHTTTRVTSKHNKGKETNRGIHISSNMYMYTSAKHTFGFDTSHHHSSPNNSRVKNKKCKTGITDMMQTEKGCRWITLLSLFFQSGDSSEPPPSFRRLGGRPKTPKEKTNGCNPLRGSEWVETLFTKFGLGAERGG